MKMREADLFALLMRPKDFFVSKITQQDALGHPSANKQGTGKQC